MDPAPKAKEKPVDAVICVDTGVYARYRAVLRHLCVGLIDVVSTVRLVTSAIEVQSLNLGPVTTVLHKELRWPRRKQRLQELEHALESRPPTVVHAMSASCYALAEHLAAAFDADLVYQVTAVQDVDALHLSHHGTEYGIICSSQPLAERCSKQVHIDARRVALIRPGVICSNEPTCFGEADRLPTILTTADLTADSGVDTLLHALHRLKQSGHQFLAFFLGAGPAEYNLRQIAKMLGLGSWVVFARPEGNVRQAMIGADLFVQPGVELSLSARSLQALGQGMAVVGVAGGVHDSYVPDETALVIPASTAPFLADAIERLLKDRNLARRLAAGAIAYMRKHHTMTAMAESTAEVYRDLARRRSRRPVAP